MYEPHVAYIGLGSNLGNRRANLRAAIRYLRGTPGVTVTDVSRVYETSPVDAGGGAFLNAAARVHTTRAPRPLLSALAAIERRMGRARFGVKRHGPRIIDLDLLLHGDAIRRSPALTLPHPRLHLRKFVLRPLLDLDPAVRHPKFRRPLKSFLAGLPASQKIRPVGMRRA